MLDRMFMGAAADDKLFVEDVFSTYLYRGNGADSQIITNGINLSGKGGMVWTKSRTSSATHSLIDTVRGVNKLLSSPSTAAQVTDDVNQLYNVSSTGYSVANGDFSSSLNNINGVNYVSWTFRKAPKFFDVVTYTGDGTDGRTINHNLGVMAGFVVIKRTDSTGNWYVAAYNGTNAFFRSSAANDFGLNLNTESLSSVGAGNNFFNATSINLNGMVADADVSQTQRNKVNANGATYVAYIFAHDPTADGIIQCGSYTGNGSATGPVVTLGWEPQWVLIKRVSGSSSYGWMLMDNMRGMPVGGADAFLMPNYADLEYPVQLVDPTATGFAPNTTLQDVNASGSTYIYIAIRRGPMRTPTLGTSVFKPDASTSTGGTFVSTGFPVDTQIIGRMFGAGHLFVDKLRGASSTTTEGGKYLQTTDTLAEASGGVSRNWSNVGYDYPPNFNGQSNVMWSFRRAPGFFDVVCHTNQYGQIPHNLGVAPELMITKARNVGTGSASNWYVHRFNADGRGARLGSSNAWFNNFGAGSPVGTATTFETQIFSLSDNYITYLFASCPNVSKVGVYTGNGSSQTINCAFSNGARFILIKRDDSAGDWYVWDTARGIVAGNDPHLSLNSTAAEVTTDDTIDTDSSGFVVNQVAATNVNVNAATYIYLAIA